METTCPCPAGTAEVVVRDGTVVERRHIGEQELPADAEPDPSLAPSITEVLERLRMAYEEDPESITDIAVEESGMLIRIAFDPDRDAQSTTSSPTGPTSTSTPQATPSEMK